MSNESFRIQHMEKIAKTMEDQNTEASRAQAKTVRDAIAALRGKPAAKPAVQTEAKPEVQPDVKQRQPYSDKRKDN